MALTDPVLSVSTGAPQHTSSISPAGLGSPSPPAKDGEAEDGEADLSTPKQKHHIVTTVVDEGVKDDVKVTLVLVSLLTRQPVV